MAKAACSTILVVLIAALALWVKTELDRGCGFVFLCRVCLFNEITGSDGSLGEGVAELTAEQVTEGVDLRGKVGIVTGANSGIGLETARVMAMRGAEVIMACRSLTKCNEAKAAIEASSTGSLRPMALDLASLQSVRAFAEEFAALGLPLHYLVNNAAVLPTVYGESPEGLELTFVVNSLSPFYLTELLLPTLKASAPSRIINVGSATQHMIDEDRWARTTQPLSEAAFYASGFFPFPAPLDFSPIGVYANTKLSKALTTAELRRRLNGTGVTAAVVHPGLFPSALTRHSDFVSFAFHVVPKYTDALGITRAHKTTPQGASTTLWTMVNDISGSVYYADNAPHDHSAIKSFNKIYLNEEAGKATWAEHEAILRRYVDRPESDCKSDGAGKA